MNNGELETFQELQPAGMHVSQRFYRSQAKPSSSGFQIRHVGRGWTSAPTRARISPLRGAGAISGARLGTLTGAIREVLQDAIAAGGSSLRDFRRADGELGYFQHSFDVYGREGKPCRTPGCAGTIRRVVQAGRSTFYCTACQR